MGEGLKESKCHSYLQEEKDEGSSLDSLTSIPGKVIVVRCWKRLPRGVVDAQSLEASEVRLDGALRNRI